MIKYTPSDFNADIKALTKRLKVVIKESMSVEPQGIYGIPRGGIPLATALSATLGIPLINRPAERNWQNIIVVDDLIDSGRTLKPFVDRGIVTAVLHRKPASPHFEFNCYVREIEQDWIEYFWEKTTADEQDIPVRLLEMIGEDLNREGLRETPERFIRSWRYLTSGYGQKPEDVIKVFKNEGYDQIVLLKNIELYSTCEHHLLPFWGRAHVAYIPDKKVIGISKLARLVDMYARRIQIQERLGDQVVKAIADCLSPQGAACIIEASHLCMRMRGVQKQNSKMVTSSLTGVFMEKDSAARQELMELIK